MMATAYKIGEAAALLNLKTYVLRFWETEFPQIVPLRTDKGQRLYTEENLALLERIRFLLHERCLTIEGARKILSEDQKKGVTYAFAGDKRPAGQRARTVPDREDDGASPEDAAADAMDSPGMEARGPRAACSPQVGDDAPDDEENAEAAQSPQYTLPGVHRSSPIREFSLFEDRRGLLQEEDADERPCRRRDASPPRRAQDGLPDSASRDGGREMLPAGHREAARAQLRTLALELEDILLLLRGGDSEPVK
jgi:DNA-binding transcriptional MerR regulator